MDPGCVSRGCFFIVFSGFWVSRGAALRSQSEYGGALLRHLFSMRVFVDFWGPGVFPLDLARNLMQFPAMARVLGTW